MLKKNNIYPVLDLGACSECGGCMEIAPDVFKYNEATGRMEIVDLEEYPLATVDEAMKNCPKDCIHWDHNE